MICPDEVLREIVRIKPKSPSELLDINGFNQRMFNKIGEDFLNVLKSYSDSEKINAVMKQKNIPGNILKVLELLQKKYSLSDISSFTKLPESIVSTQIETLLELQPGLEIDFLFEKNELKNITKKIKEGIVELKTLREALENKLSYAKLRIAVAKHRVS